MPEIHICPLSRLEETVRKSGAKHVVTLINAGMEVAYPLSVPVHNRLRLSLNDIVKRTPGLDPPEKRHAQKLIEFVRDWDQTLPLVIHCWMGVSRSTAGAYIALCSLLVNNDERELAFRLRAAAPFATPNMLLVQYADDLLARNGRMVDAIDEIGRGEDTFEGEPFLVEI